MTADTPTEPANRPPAFRAADLFFGPPTRPEVTEGLRENVPDLRAPRTAQLWRSHISARILLQLDPSRTIKTQATAQATALTTGLSGRGRCTIDPAGQFQIVFGVSDREAADRHFITDYLRDALAYLKLTPDTVLYAAIDQTTPPAP